MGPTMPEANIYSEIFSHRKLQISASSVFFLGFMNWSWLSFHCKQKHPYYRNDLWDYAFTLINYLLIMWV